eukprot:364530-Chlamydomonas_euryale.AAC.1
MERAGQPISLACQHATLLYASTTTTTPPPAPTFIPQFSSPSGAPSFGHFPHAPSTPVRTHATSPPRTFIPWNRFSMSERSFMLRWMYSLAALSLRSASADALVDFSTCTQEGGSRGGRLKGGRRCQGEGSMGAWV